MFAGGDMLGLHRRSSRGPDGGCRAVERAAQRQRGGNRVATTIPLAARANAPPRHDRRLREATRL